MDFAKELTDHENVTTKSGIRILPESSASDTTSTSSLATSASASASPTITNLPDDAEMKKEHVGSCNISKNNIYYDDNHKRTHIRNLLIKQANKAAADLFLSTGSRIFSTIKSIKKDATMHKISASGLSSDHDDKSHLVDCKLYPTKLQSPSSTIEPGSLVVIFESFDSLNFVYATPGEVFHNRNGHFHHDDFIGKPFGCKIRSRNNRGFGFLYLLRPTPELWARSLNHRTQIIHELDSAVIVFHLNLRPNMIVCESGTGSGAMSHCIMRAIAPHGKLHTYEFNKVRAKTARDEFRRNGVGHLVQVHWRDVCGKKPTTAVGTESEVSSTSFSSSSSSPVNSAVVPEDEALVFEKSGGFGIGPAIADAIFLDLPEPWLAIPHAAHAIKPNGGLCSYSPCVEQTQRTVQALKDYGFHSLKTIEVRLREHYVDDVELETVPTSKLPRDLNVNTYVPGSSSDPIQQEKKKEEQQKQALPNHISSPTIDSKKDETQFEEMNDMTEYDDKSKQQIDRDDINRQQSSAKKRKMICARPFANMRGHTAFLTFAKAGNKIYPDPNQ